MAHAGNGGLQQHSIGDTYPWTVVGSIDEGGTIYYIANLVTNRRDKAVYESSYVAHEIAKLISQGLVAPVLEPWLNSPLDNGGRE